MNTPTLFLFSDVCAQVVVVRATDLQAAMSLLLAEYPIVRERATAIESRAVPLDHEGPPGIICEQTA